MTDGINWNGGQIEVTRGIGGWEVSHRIRTGETYSLDWQKHKTEAVSIAKKIAEQRGSIVLVQA